MQKIRNWCRLLYIAYVFNKYNITAMLADIPLLKALKFTLYFNPFYWFHRNQSDRGMRLRLALTDLGPIFIKFGQALSTRRDLLPIDLADELAKLQDEVPPFPSDCAIKSIEKALEQSIEQAFLHFDRIPLASASIAQVHSAELVDGREVVVKVLRPDIEKILKQDTILMSALARMLERYIAKSRRFQPVKVVAEISKNLLDELDLLREAANASQLRRNFEDSNIHYVPEVYWPYCRKNILVIEKISGIPVSDTQQLKSVGTNFKLLAERGVEIFYTQVFRDCFFHADMHPGNIFVDVKNPHDPKYISVDFGIVGTLTRQDQHYLASNFIAFFNRDYRKVSELHIESGWVSSDTRVDELESAIRTVCEPIFEKSLAEISFGSTLMRLFQVARRFNMPVQPQLILLQKTLINIEGLGLELYPQLNLWATAKPFLERWMKSRIGWQGFLKRTRENLPSLSEKLPDIPDLIINLLQSKHQCNQQNNVLVENSAYTNKPSNKRRFLLFIGIPLTAIGVLFPYVESLAAPIYKLLSQYASLISVTGIIILLWYLLTRPRL